MEKLLYGRKEGLEGGAEQLLCTQPDRFEQVKVLASKDGFKDLRIVNFDPSAKPDFTNVFGK